MRVATWSAAVVSLALLRHGPARSSGPAADDAATLTRLAESLLRNGEATSARSLLAAEGAVAAAEQDGDALAQAAAERVLGRILVDRGELAAGRAHLERALERRTTSLPAGAPARRESMQDLAEVLIKQGQRRPAAALLDDLAQRAGGLMTPAERGRTLLLQAKVAREEGRYQAALRLAQQAHAPLAAGVDPLAIIDLMGLLGDLAWFEGDYECSRDLYGQALELARAALPASHPTIGACQANLAQAEFDRGDVAVAGRLQRAAMELTQAARGETHPETIDRVHSLANFCLDAGEFPEARTLYERVLRLTEQRFGAESDEAATVLHNIGLLDARMGRAEPAREALQRALELWERTRGRDHLYVARALDLLADVRAGQGELAAAHGLLQRSIAIRQREGHRAGVDLAWAWARVADVEVRRGRRTEAMRAAHLAAELCRPLASQTRADVGGAFVLLGQVELSLGRVATASAHFAAALRIYGALFGPNHLQVASAQARWAYCLWRRGRPAEAFLQAADAERARREHLRRTLRYLSEPQALDFAARLPEGRDVLLSIAAAPRASAAQVARAFEAVVLSRALVLDEMASRRQAAPAGAAAAELEALHQRVARLLYRDAESPLPLEARAAALGVAQAELESRQRSWAATSATARAQLQQEVASLERLRAALPPGSALVSLVRYGEMLPVHTRAPERYMAFVLRAGAPRPRAISLGAASALDESLWAWRAQLDAAAEAAARPQAVEARSRVLGRELKRLLWDPIAPLLAGARLVLVVPDGPLSFVNLAALPMDQTAYLVESGPTVHYLSTERDLLQPQRSSPGNALLAVGGPDYDDAGGERAPAPSDAADGSATRGAGGAAWRTNCVDPERLRFTFLPEAWREAQDVATRWRRLPGTALVLTSRQANERAFKREAAGKSVLHLATHGFFAGAGCVRDTTTGHSAEARLWRENPLLQSGLAFAGANRRSLSPREDDDGLLTAAEVARLDLQGTSWVVLSACGSGLGQLQDGEGVLGLRRAFALAGAGTVVMSLWAVDDKLTRDWMGHLYESRLAEGRSTAEAVRAAHRLLLQSLRQKHGGAAPPALWAPFVAAGDWR